MDLIEQAHRYAMQLPFASPAVPVAHPAIGRIGLCVPGRGFRIMG